MSNQIVQVRYFVILLLVALSLSSCFNSKKVAYFQNVGDSSRVVSVPSFEPVVHHEDILSISVSSLSPEAALIFNAPNQPITPTAMSNPNMPQTAGYLVNQDGNIEFPVLGTLRAAGLTPKELEKVIKEQLEKRELLYDPVVNIRFLNYRVTVLGEVNKPGVVFASGEQISILEAIGMAGDLTIYGLRNNVLLIRTDGNQKLMQRIDLTSTELLRSPYFYLKSNDIIYIEPGKNKLASTDATLRILPVVFSGVSVIVVVLNSLLK